MTSPKILCIPGLALSLLFAMGGLKAQTVTRAATFRTGSQLVLVPFTVTDHNARTVVGLEAKDFKIFDDKIPQPIVSFSYEDAPSSIGLVLDISGSMQRVLGSVKDAAKDFVRTANPSDEFLLLTVSTLPAAGSEFTTDTEALQDLILGTAPGGFTALMDTAYLGLDRMKKANNPQRALVILSDGIDNHSRYSRGELLRVALEADVQIYSIIMNNGSGGTVGEGAPFRPSMIAKPGARAAEAQGPDLLETLAEKTGGLYFHVHNDGEVLDAMAKTGQALRNQYVIGYKMPASESSGKWHQVKVSTSGLKVNVHSRSGYYTP